MSAATIRIDMVSDTREFPRHETVVLYVTTAFQLALLIVQLVLGFWLALFAVFPPYRQTAPFFMASMMNSMFGMPDLALHMGLGMVIAFVSVMILIVSLLSGRISCMVMSVVAMAAVLFAGIGGMGFVWSGFGNDVFSFIMAIGALAAVVSYSIQLGSISAAAGKKAIA